MIENVRTFKKTAKIQVTAEAADDTAGAVTINITNTPQNYEGLIFSFQVRRAGEDVTLGAIGAYSGSTGLLTIGDGGTYVVTAGDVFVIKCTLLNSPAL